MPTVFTAAISCASVQCSALGSERTHVTVVYSLTSLTAEGGKFLQSLDEAAFRRFIESWEASIAKAIAAA